MTIPQVSQKTALMIVVPLFLGLLGIGLYMWPKGKSVEDLHKSIKESQEIEAQKLDSLKTK
jgi:cytochrome c-type biogenesis protein CcmH/NrfF